MLERVGQEREGRGVDAELRLPRLRIDRVVLRNALGADGAAYAISRDVFAKQRGDAPGAFNVVAREIERRAAHDADVRVARARARPDEFVCIGVEPEGDAVLARDDDELGGAAIE